MSEKNIIEQNTDMYYGVSIPAHILSLYRNAINQFIHRTKKPFFIDPMSYVFFLDRSIIKRADGRIKRSYVKMAELSPRGLELLETDVSDLSSLSPSDIHGMTNTIVDIALKSQIPNQIHRPGQESLRRIKKEVGSPSVELELPSPQFLVTPYFYIDEVGEGNIIYDEWLRAMNRFEKRANEINPKMRIYKAVLISKSILEDDPSLSKLMTDLGNLDGIVFWIEDLENGDPSVECLEGMKTFISGLKNVVSERIIALYGGYLTAIFHHMGLDAFCYGVSSGDQKTIESRATGGGAPSRYYCPNTHRFQTARNLLQFYLSQPGQARYFSCNCAVCNPVSSQITSSTGKKDARRILKQFFEVSGTDVIVNWHATREHFLRARQNELHEIENTPITDLIESATAKLSEFNSLPEHNLKLVVLEYVSRMTDIQN